MNAHFDIFLNKAIIFSSFFSTLQSIYKMNGKISRDKCPKRFSMVFLTKNPKMNGLWS